jgi:ABC-type nitrate/sulfonate/bicarbonate transport system substrate-binding protein
MIGLADTRRSEAYARAGRLRIGYVPLCDCAPLVMARELGLFAARGLDVALSREVGWATIRDKIVLRDLEAAHAPAGLVLAASLGIGSFQAPCLTGLVLNLNGNAITLSDRLWDAGVRDSRSLGEFVRRDKGNARLTFGVAFSWSSHDFLLREWLRSGGVEAPREVNIVVVPPPQMARNLKAGTLDGYCVGEPWNSVAVLRRAGHVVAVSARIAPGHPEKVLLARADFAERRAAEHQSLISALHEACAYCQCPDNRERIVCTLARLDCLGLRPEALRMSLCHPFAMAGDGGEKVEDFHIFAGAGVNEPSLDKALWVRESLRQSGVLAASGGPERADLAAMFRLDLFQSAKVGRVTPCAPQRPSALAE